MTFLWGEAHASIVGLYLLMESLDGVIRKYLMPLDCHFLQLHLGKDESLVDDSFQSAFPSSFKPLELV